jgi:hypothetical protein
MNTARLPLRIKHRPEKGRQNEKKSEETQTLYLTEERESEDSQAVTGRVDRSFSVEK